MLKEILAVSGKPGLFKLISKGNNLLIIESMTDKKRIPAYARDKVISLNDVSIYTDEEEVPVRIVLDAIKEKEGCKSISIDYTKAQPDELRAYLAEVLPNFDRERVYPSDIKKLMKWYDTLIANDITDFSVKEEEVTEDAATTSEGAESEEDAKAAAKPKGEQKATKTASTKRKDSSLSSVNQSKATKAKSTPKTSTPKKSVVGAKRGG
jgi:hypothetical protein